jgi:hypothetical protein
VEAAARGRPSTCTPGKLQAICSFIRLTGLSDTGAAAMAGVKRSTFARWKQEDDEVELQLDQARFQYQAPRLAKIDETRLKNGELDWRAQAWLVKFANPEVYGAPSRRRKLREVEVEPEAPLTPEEQRAEEEAEGLRQLEQVRKDWERFYREGGVITPEMLATLQQRRAIALREMKLREMNEERPAAATEVPAPDARPGHEPAEAGGAAAPEPATPPKSVTIRPEIRGLYREPGGCGRPAGAPAHPAAVGAPPAMERRRTEAMAG